MNTKITYQYRDASNYKLSSEVIIKGELSFKDLEPYLIDSQFFVPEELQLPRLQFDSHTEDDHDWHEFLSLEPCSDPPSISLTSQQLIKAAKSYKLSHPYI